MVGTRNWSDTKELTFIVSRNEGVTFVNLRKRRIVGSWWKKKRKEMRSVKFRFEIGNGGERFRQWTRSSTERDQQERDLLDRPSGIGCLSTINNLSKPRINSEYWFSRRQAFFRNILSRCQYFRLNPVIKISEFLFKQGLISLLD